MLLERKKYTRMKYRTIVARTAMPMLGQKCSPWCNSAGKRRKNPKEGSTNQNIDWESWEILSSPAFSNCIQMMASREVSGNDAMRAPIKELRLANSLIRTIMAADIPTFIT